MQLFFNKSIVVARTLAHDQSWNYTKAGLQRNLDTVINYYHTRGYAVKSNHFLVKLLNIIGVDYNTRIERFYEIVSAKTNKLAMHLKMTNSVYSGQLFNGVFYGQGTKEIIIADDTYISPYEIQANWKSIQAVTVLDHPRSDLYMLLPNGKATSTETGLATIVVNIPALAAMYREFLREQYVNTQEGIDPSTTAFFVHRYVLPNMMPTHQDVALFNRINNLMIGKPMGAPLAKHPFVLLDYTSHVDKLYRDLVYLFKHNEYDFWTVLRSIPLLNVENAQKLMKLPEQAATRQLAWAEFLTRLKCIEFLISASPSHGAQMSRKDLNYLLKKIVNYSSDGIFRQISDAEVYTDTIRTVKDIVQMTSKQNYSLLVD